MLDKENEIFKEEFRTLEQGKSNGKTFTLRELDSYANVNLRASNNKKPSSLVRDGGKLMPVKSPKAAYVEGRSYNLTSDRSKNSVGSITNKSRLVVRDNADGTTQMIRMKPSGIPKLRQSHDYMKEAGTPQGVRRGSNEPNS